MLHLQGHDPRLNLGRKGTRHHKFSNIQIRWRSFVIFLHFVAQYIYKLPPQAIYKHPCSRIYSSYHDNRSNIVTIFDQSLLTRFSASTFCSLTTFPLFPVALAVPLVRILFSGSCISLSLLKSTLGLWITLIFLTLTFLTG